MNRYPADPVGSWRPSPSTRRMVVATVVILGLLAALVLTASFWINWWWFESVGYRSVLTTRYASRTVAFLVGGALAAAFFATNWLVALRRSGPAAPSGGTEPALPLRLVLWVLTGVVALLAASAAASHWQRWLLLGAGGSFGVSDPIFGHDAGFYVFTVPALAVLHRGAVSLLLATIVTVVVVYALRLGLGGDDLRNPPRSARSHVLALGGALLLLFALGYLLANYGLLYSTRGAVYGAGFTDANVSRWANYLLALLSAATAALLLLNAVVRRLRSLLIALGVWAVAAVLLGVALPAIVQQVIVQPSEQRRERAYIENNITLTRSAFGLEGTETRALGGGGEPDPAALTPDSPTFDNIRLWDYRVVQQAYQQDRSFVPYYAFNDVDVDRYEVDGRVRQVLVSARELNQDGLATAARTWGNRHLAYTHGYGAVVSPVSEATQQGLPRYLVGGVPPEGTGTLAIERPEIYFGERTDDWVAVNTELPEVNGIGGEIESAPYAGAARGSIGLDSYPRRLLLAVSLGDRNLLLNDDLTGESRVLLRRDIVERARAIAPFLTYDPDPYLVIADGRLVWVIDAYTETDRFPGSQPHGGINYVRHAAKVTIDAYDGTVTFYRTGSADAIADAYAGAFGDLFVPIAEAPPTLADHFRYPERLFDLQAEVYDAYHVTEPTAFYNGDDRWAVAREQVEGQNRRDNETRPMEAYYVTLPLPGETESGFGLVLPFTPANRQNMTAWMAGRTDEAGVPRLVVYRFPQQESIAGPQLIEARVNAEPEISSQISLLGQGGSRVILGNLLVIPVGEAVLYAQPFYVRSDAEGAPTQLQYVVVATNERIAMRRTLPEALAAIAAGGELTAPAQTGGTAGGNQGPPRPTGDADGPLARQALDALQRAQDAAARGDWAAYGEEQAGLEAILLRLAAEGGANTGAATPEAIPAPGQ